ncbi:MAG TPA: ATPase, T2SS/T4P/T4SS family [Pyrinomonadaceae bacterium]|nr:ATPase, T2SS/T4P/T4SS family [Pyrinomonadaceae bacterium]
MTSPDILPRSVDVDDLPGPDFTTYLPIQSETTPNEGKLYSQDGSVDIVHGGTNINGRGLICRAYRDSYWSVTLRSEAKNKRKSGNQYLTDVASCLRNYAANYPEKIKPQDYLGYCPEGFDTYSKIFRKDSGESSTKETSADPKAGVFLNDIYQVCVQLHEILLADRRMAPTGLITVTGATDSSKSLITRGLIFLYLQAAAQEALSRKLRRPHLVTFEDPIEQYYIKDPDKSSAPQNLEVLNKLLAAINIDYTPREKRADADGLAAAIKDAKRQTPAVFFVGETRDADDWKALLEFGGSGHLVITTSHAGSVVEAMTQIFRHTKTENPSQRSEIARRILGVINLRTFNPTSNDISSNVRVLLPAVWKSTSQSINNLVADGLSSILPALGREQEIGYFGRTHFADTLINQASTEFKSCPDQAALTDAIMRKAMEWDIRGV